MENIKELSRSASSNEAMSTYQASGNLLVHLTSRFDNKVKIEDVIYETVLKKIITKSNEEA